MSDSCKVAGLCAFSVFGMLISVSAVSLSAAVACGAFTFAGALTWLSRSLPAHSPGLWELAPFLALSPLLFVYVTTPGADAAMYAAIARALGEGRPELSAAYPGVHVVMYPRAYPGLIAVLAPSLGMPKACLFAALLSYVMFVSGLAFWLRGSVAPRAALALALLLTLAGRNVPLGFFAWGGNPTIMAFGMALTAVVLVAGAAQANLFVCSALILAGAFAVHPIGAFGGAACAPIVLLWPRPELRRVLRVVGATALALPLLLAFKLYGPAISPREADWITHWQLGAAKLLRHRFGAFPLDYLETLQHALGVVLTSIAGVCLVIALRRGGTQRKLAWLAVLGLAYLAVLVAVGPKLPMIGTFVYADRLSPVWLVVLGPLIASVLAAPPAWSRSWQLLASAVAVGLAHANWQNGTPLLDADELALSTCIRQKVPQGAWIVASYGQGGQWLPALTGHPVTQAHTHCSLFDETDALREHVVARYQLLSDHEAQYERALPALGAAETLCQHGGAKLIRLQTDAPPIAGVY